MSLRSEDVAEVLDTVEMKGRKAVVLRLREGEVQVGQILRSRRNGSVWRVCGTSFAPPEAWSDGRRGVTMEWVEGPEELSSGDFLVVDQEIA